MNNLCHICNTYHKTCGGLVTHVVKLHKLNSHQYYDKFLKQDFDGFCKNCKSPTSFHNLSKGYRTTCSRECSRKLMCTPEIRLKVQKIILDKYGTDRVKINEKISRSQKKRLENPKEREKISIGTKKAMQREDVKEKLKYHHDKGVSETTRMKQSMSAKDRFINDPTIRNKIFTTDRNQKISIAKKQYWKDHPEERKRVGLIWKILKNRDETAWRDRLLKASKKGFEKIYRGNGETSLEKKLYKFLDDNGIRYTRQYELCGKLFDAYLTEYNILLEFDGEFWHKKTLEECIYDFQKTSFYNDKLKTKIASDHNISLYRIRENEDPSIILDIILKIPPSR